MAKNPTSSSTMQTTLGAPSGAVGGSNGVQSGTESLMSTLMVPLNALLIEPVSRPAFPVPVLVPLCPRRGLGSATEQLGLGGGEFLVAQRALLAQFVELVELIDHGRSLRRGRLRRGLLVLRRGLLVLLLLVLLLRLKVGKALVLVGLRVCLLFPPPARGPAGRVCATADHGRAQQWASPDHDLSPSSSCWSGPAYVPSPSTPAGRDRPRATMISGAAATVRGPPTCGATAFSTPRRSSGVQSDPSALATCHR